MDKVGLQKRLDEVLAEHGVSKDTAFITGLKKDLSHLIDEYAKSPLDLIKERREYFATKDLYSGWSGRESGPCCDKCAIRPEHFTGRADALKAKVGCRNPFQLKETCQCHIPVREAVRNGIVEAHDQLIRELEQRRRAGIGGDKNG